MAPNSREALVRRRDAGTLTWRGPAVMLFARAALAVGAQAIVVVALVWSLQHAFMPLTFDPRFMAFRLLSPIPESLFVTLLYLRLRRLLPLAISHALMDGATVVIGTVLPLVRG